MPRAALLGQRRAPVQLDLEAGPAAGDTLVAAALKILTQPCSNLKASWTQRAAQLWCEGLLRPPMAAGQDAGLRLPDTPARDAKVRPQSTTPEHSAHAFASRHALPPSLLMA